MFRVQLRLNGTWRDLTYPNPMSWDDAYELFKVYMNTWTNNDYRIVPVWFFHSHNPLIHSFTMTASPFRSNTNNITEYNMLRDGLIEMPGCPYRQLFGLKLYELEDLFYYNDPVVRYKVTGRKRDWLAVQFDKMVDFFELREGWLMSDIKSMSDKQFVDFLFNKMDKHIDTDLIDLNDNDGVDFAHDLKQSERRID